MTPGATLLALPGFQGDVVVQIGETGKNFDTGGWPNDQYLLNGKIDGSKQGLVGLRLPLTIKAGDTCSLRLLLIAIEKPAETKSMMLETVLESLRDSLAARP